MIAREAWMLPYRSMDASGSAESAGQVGWDWLREIATAEHEREPRGLEIDQAPLGNDGGANVLYRDRKPIAAFFVFRDPMNFAQLVRWKAPA